MPNTMPQQANTLSRFHLIFTIIAASALSACATGKSVKGPDDLVDDGERNTMVVSYDLTVNTIDKHPNVDRTSVVLRCGKPNRFGAVPTCFSVNVPLIGRRDKDGYNYYTFKVTGAQALQMPYGLFDIASIQHSVLVDLRNKVSCSVNKKGRTICQTVPERITKTHKGTPNVRKAISIEPGVGCYAGHISFEMTESAINDYSLDQSLESPTAETIEMLPVDLQGVVRDRVTQACVPG